MNVAVLAKHQAAFGLYILSITVYYIFYTIHYLDYKSSKMTKVFYYSGIFCAFSNFFAQLCLGIIFWQFAAGFSSANRMVEPETPTTGTIPMDESS